MPSPRPELRLDDLRDHVRREVFRPSAAGKVAVEVELTPFVFDELGRPDHAGVQRFVDGFWTDLGGDARRKRLPFRGGALTTEPGGQVEFSGPPLESPEAAARDALDSACDLVQRARSRDVALVSIGVHPWADPEEIGQNNRAPRYPAMQAYFDRIGPMGRRMMRLTGSLQVCVDCGAPEEIQPRWELAMRLAPVLTAVFANSAVLRGRPHAFASARAEAWLSIDPRRSGAPAAFLREPTGDPVEGYLEFALDAPVMFIAESGPEGPHHLPAPDFTFRTWLRDGSAFGWPARDDWDLHLSTLFPDVRPRGYLEVRAIDAPPLSAIPAAILLAGTALTRSSSTGELLEMLRAEPSSPSELRERAAKFALRDDALARLGRELFRIVRAQGLPPDAEALLAEYDERHVQTRRTPGDELAELCSADADRALTAEAFLALEASRRPCPALTGANPA